tara:strand:+ start:52 stop:561 length:510 start_codon:yes stop_codon:yes gene_type:complete
MQLATERLTVRELTLDDADFILRLLNTEAFKVNIGDRQVRTIADAEDKISNFYTTGYPEHGLFAVDLKETNETIGTVSYLTRDYLEHDDIGYAFLPEFWGKGYATEATKSVLDYKIENGEKCIWGVVNSDNHVSIKLLEKLGFQTTGMVVMEGEEEPILKLEYKVTELA